MKILQQFQRKKFIVVTVLYFLLGALYILNGYINSEILKAFKVAPFIVLIYYLAQHWRNNNVLRAIVAVILGAIGDLILEYGSQSTFNIGAGSFLVGHVIYNIAIMDRWKTLSIKLLFKRRIFFFVSCIILISIGSINLATSLKGESLINCILFPGYITFLTLNCINSTVLLCGNQITAHHLWLWIGAFSFYLSDNILGKTKFTEFTIGDDRRYNDILIMLTYYVGQYFLTNGIKALSIKDEKTQDSQVLDSLIETPDTA